MVTPHRESKETYEFIADWVAPNFFHSKNDVCERMGPLALFGEIAMAGLPVGDIAEVGCGESSIYLSHLARKYRRKVYHCDLADGKIINPLTVPGYMHTEALELSPRDHNRLITVGNSNFFMGSSNDLFKIHLKDSCLAFTFIDGDHEYAQAKQDFDNAMNLTVENGYVLLHDTYPPSPKYLSPDSACGDVYRLRQEIEADKRYDSLTLVHGVAMDVGLTIVRKKPLVRPYFQE